MNPSGVQLARPRRPPSRSTRSISLALRRWSGANIAPNADVSPDTYPTDLDREMAELWPADPSVAAGYDLDDWIGGEIQTKYTQALQRLVRDYDVDAFISAMVDADTRSQ